jgi:hypothetical protein
MVFVEPIIIVNLGTAVVYETTLVGLGMNTDENMGLRVTYGEANQPFEARS